LELLGGGLQVTVDGGIFLVEILKVIQVVVLDLVAVAIIDDVPIVMKVTVGVVGGRRHQRPVVVERTVLSPVIGIGVVLSPVDNDFDPITMCCGSQVIELGPPIVDIAKVLLHAHEIAVPVTMIRSGNGCSRICIQVFIVIGWRDPDTVAFKPLM
jgi:hypothetical protein